MILRGAVLAVALGGLVLPIAAGLAQTAGAALGRMPVLGLGGPTLDPLRRMLAEPGLLTAIRLTLTTGLGATLGALALSVGFCAAVHARITPARGARMLAPFLAAPHAAMAIGLAFLLAPSGWIARLLAPLAGWDLPPDLATVGDPWGLALTVGLMVKEAPFLLLAILTALRQVPVRAQMAQGRSLGYGRGLVWIKVILPQVWPMIRLPVMVVLAYGLSVVDMALILGPSTPPTLAVLLTRAFADPDLMRLPSASAGALLQLALVGVGLAGLLLAERLGKVAGRAWLRRGGRGLSSEPLLRLATALTLILMLAGALAMASLVAWSVAWRWPWPQVWPESLSLRAWSHFAGLTALANTLILALATTALSLALAIAWLQSETFRPRARRAEALIWLPLLIPQVSFLFGLNLLFLRAGIGGLVAVIWGQALFVFPYVMIALSEPWRALDPRFDRSAAALGAGPWRRLIAVRLPILLAPLCTAAAVGVAVSVAQYLPTLFLGAGRIPTLTTEAVTLASGSDRRVTGATASLQAGLPFIAYLMAALIPAALHRNRAALKGEAAP
jgi:putative thiamine transport system permease protein